MRAKPSIKSHHNFLINNVILIILLASNNKLFLKRFGVFFNNAYVQYGVYPESLDG